MKRIPTTLAVVLTALCGLRAGAEELVGVPGSGTQYTTPLEIKGDPPVRLVLTGTAMRKKLGFNVYALGSYVVEGAAVRTADELAAADTLKLLHLVMERDVDAKDVAEAFKAAIRANYPEPAFADELTALVELLRASPVKRGDHIYLVHVPGVGLNVNLVGKTEHAIKSVAFARAVWEIYLGKNNLGETIKKGLTSRL